ncbi:MAG: YqjK-like family protein [Rhodocyclaceae bacterium]|jgi:hypothetical protein|nr:YqjK-like family protein [Rhodocyclaceae bacterium]
MSARLLELALKKQRLQFQSAALRQKLQADVAGLAPLFRAGDSVVSGVRWIRDRPQWVAGVAALLLVTRPHWLWRWTRRGFFTWQTWRRLRDWSAER